MTGKLIILFFSQFIILVYSYGNPLTYEINEDEIRVTDCNINYEGSLIIPSSFKGKPVTSIGIEAFLFCKNITSIYIPKTIVKIEHAAFSYCDNLIKFEVNKFNQHFSSENGVLLDKGKSKILQYPAGKSGIYTIPKSVVNISDRAFLQCWKLNGIMVPSENNYYSSKNGVLYDKLKTTLIQFPNGKSGEFAIPMGVKKIGNRAFYGSQQLKKLYIPNGVLNIGYRAFYHCKNLENITIPKTVKSIGRLAFNGCASLKSIDVSKDNIVYLSYDGVLFEKNSKKLIICPAGKVGIFNIPDDVSSIGDKAFWNCKFVTEINIGKEIQHIGYGAFAYCRGLRSFSVSLENLYYSSLDGVLMDKKKRKIIQFPIRKGGSYKFPSSITIIGEESFSGCNTLTNLIIPNNVTLIERAAFKGCSRLKHINIPDNIKIISDELFYGCVDLLRVTFPEILISIGKKSFYGCKNLTFLIMPKSVRIIDRVAFGECKKLKFVFFQGQSPEKFETDIFSGISRESKVIVSNETKLGFGDYFAGIQVVSFIKNTPFLLRDSDHRLNLIFNSDKANSYSIEASIDWANWNKILEVNGNGSFVNFIYHDKLIYQKRFFRLKMKK